MELAPDPNHLDALKLRTYRLGLGLASGILTLLLLQTLLTGPLNPEEQYLFPIALAFCIGFLILFRIYGHRFLPIFEALVYALIFIYDLTHFLQGLNIARMTNSPIDFDRFLIWLAVIYVVAFMYFPTRWAMVASGIFVASLAIPSGYHLWVVRNWLTFAQDFAMLLNIMASGVVFSILFYTLATLKESFAEAISTARTMTKRAEVDHLTQIYSRAKIFEILEWHLVDSSASVRPFSILVADIDDLKHINDTFGHTAGDEILKLTADAMRRVLRRSDAFGRVGGDEFLVICPDTGEEEVQRLKTRLIRAVAETSNPFGKLSISCDAATWKQGDTVETLFHRADQAMYQNKLRNKISSSTLSVL
ncbi:MAG: GGDEF domain-containing protein [Anaerolineales bacterium]|nr:GGDEF domain-containing protein [Chloroflexota bacterium]MBL6981870.1 GGDEF domain-containing protein [Anaerolineales bacterium]